MDFVLSSVVKLYSSLQMAAIGVLLAIAIQMGLTYLFTRVNSNVLLAEDRWTPAYFGFAGISWVLSAAIASYLTLPLADVWTGRDAYKADAVLLLPLMLLVLRNRQQKPREQSLLVVLFFTVCIGLGGTAGSMVWIKQHLSF